MKESEVRKLLSQREGLKIDFKRDLRGQGLQDLSKDLAAFANSEGGHIVVGADNDGNPIDLEYDPDRIHGILQAASDCRPPVTIRPSQESFGKKNLIVIEIPRSSWIHSDKLSRFPQRLGDRTVFMETGMLLSLAKARGLILGEVSLPAAGLSRSAPTKNHVDLVRLLQSPDPTIRAEAVKDLDFECYRFKIEEIRGFNQGLSDMMREKERGVIDAALMLVWRLDYFLSGKGRGKFWNAIRVSVIELATNNEDIAIRQRAIQAVCSFGDSKAIDLIIDVLAKAPAQEYEKFQFPNLLMALASKGMGHAMRRRLYNELQARKDDELRKRLVATLASMRQFHWAES